MPLYDLIKGVFLTINSCQWSTKTGSSREETEGKEDNQIHSKILLFSRRRKEASHVYSGQFTSSLVSVINWPHRCLVSVSAILSQSGCHHCLLPFEADSGRSTQDTHSHKKLAKRYFMLQSSPQGIPGPRKWLETAGPCNEFLLALGQSKSNQPSSDSQNRWIPSVCSPLLHTPRANTGLGRSSRDTHIYLKGHKSQNYSYNKLHTFSPTLFSSRAKELSPLKIHTRNLTCSSDLANWAQECWVEELSSAYCLGSVADPFCPR